MERTESGPFPVYEALQAATTVNRHLEYDWKLIEASREETLKWTPPLARQMASAVVRMKPAVKWLREPERLEPLLCQALEPVLTGERPRHYWWLVHAAGLFLLEGGATAADVLGFGSRLRGELAAQVFGAYPAPRAAELYGAFDRIWNTGEAIFCWVQIYCQQGGHREQVRGVSPETMNRASSQTVTEFAAAATAGPVTAPFTSTLQALIEWTEFGVADLQVLRESAATTRAWPGELAAELLQYLLHAPLGTGFMESSGLSRADTEERITQLFQRMAGGEEEAALFRGMWTIGLLAARAAADPSLLVAALPPLTQSILRRCMEEPEGERGASIFLAFQKTLSICTALAVEGFLAGQVRTSQLAGLAPQSLRQAQLAVTQELRSAPFLDGILSLEAMRRSGFLSLVGR